MITALVLLLTGCGGGNDEELIVSAAASLTDVFSEIEVAFESANPDIDVVLNLGGSSSLREQILEGAPADVFASASIDNMDEIVAAGEVAGEARLFATNTLQIAVPAGNPAGVSSLDDFADESRLIGLCAVGVPCGDFARLALGNAGVTPSIDTNEPDVRALLTKIEAGELDAGITYVTDVVAAGRAVEGIALPEDVNVVAEYPIARLADASDPDIAEEFIDFVLSTEGQAILTGHGFSS